MTTTEHTQAQPSRQTCPPWCTDDTADHRAYEVLTTDRSVNVRWHSAEVGQVSICQGEHLKDSRVSLAKPTILAFSEYGDELDANQARAMARDLIAAADMLDSLT